MVFGLTKEEAAGSRAARVMPQKRHRPEEIIAKLREAEILLAQDEKALEVCKSLGVSEVSYYRWRKEYGGLSVSRQSA
jgi:predicted transcriptional regulator YheO